MGGNVSRAKTTDLTIGIDCTFNHSKDNKVQDIDILFTSSGSRWIPRFSDLDGKFGFFQANHSSNNSNDNMPTPGHYSHYFLYNSFSYSFGIVVG